MPARPARASSRGARAVALALAVLAVALVAVAAGPPDAGDAAYGQVAPLHGEVIDRSIFPNPHAHVPAQCHVETAAGAQNACLFCHTDGVWRRRLGNNNPQAGANPNVGNLQTEYSFGAFGLPFVPNASINPWQNTLLPQRLRAALSSLGVDPASWDMPAWIRQDNWREAYRRRPSHGAGWDTGVDDPMRLFPALDPDDLPAADDGFVRAHEATRAIWHDGRGWNTGWRAVNFMPYGVFTPYAGAVSGIYLRLAPRFMRRADGVFDLATYAANLERVARNVQDRLGDDPPTHYLGAAATIRLERGQYPLGTEFAHPLHYVDVAADGRDPAVGRYPGGRAQRVREIRWMMKLRPWHPDEFGLAAKEESAPVVAHRTQGWIENGTGWLLAGWIEDARGRLRAQTPSELLQCVGCHSGNVRQSDIGQHATFTAGTGNTVDASWSLPRQLPGAAGWREADLLGYRVGAPALAHPEPRNRGHGRGEFGFFLDHVVGASLYGEMPAAIERDLAVRILRARGYAQDWPRLEAAIAARDPDALADLQARRLALMRAFTARGEHLDGDGRIRSVLLVPPPADALAAARRYRQVVATQRFDFGKDVFDETPLSLRYFRRAAQGFGHQDGRPYRIGEPILDRPVDPVVANLTHGYGVVPTLIDPGRAVAAGGTFVADWVPLLVTPD